MQSTDVLPIFFRPGLAGALCRLAAVLCRAGLATGVFLAPLVLLAWLAELLPMAAVQGLIASMRLCSIGYLALLLVAAIGYRVAFELAACSRGEEVVQRQSSAIPGLLVRREGLAYPLGQVALLYSAALWLTWTQDLVHHAGAFHTLWYAAAASMIALLAHLYGTRLPAHGYVLSAQDSPVTHASVAAAQVSAPAPAGAPSQGVAAAARAQADYAVPVSARRARMDFSHVHGMIELKQRLIAAATAILDARSGAGEAPRNGILLHGEPGNGKTIFAEALAGELGLLFVALTYGDVATKWIGEAPRLVANAFSYVRQAAPCVFFIDEVDSFIRSRDGAPSEDMKVANTFLTQLVDIREYPVVLIAATNFIDSLDAAAVREGRFDFKVRVPQPDEAARAGILQDALQRYAPQLPVQAQALDWVAKRWVGLSASRLVAVVKELTASAGSHQGNAVGHEDWMRALRQVQGGGAQLAGSTKRLSQLHLCRGATQALRSISQRLTHAYELEQHGGTLPAGVLLYGPPGTGKTAAAQALALETGWEFVCAAGAQLLGDRQALANLYRRACDLRPAIVCIDEADDVLRDRRVSAAAHVVNSLLALLDGAGARVPDVVFVATTNNADEIDPALLRGGRFAEQILFEPPSPALLARAARSWLQDKGIVLDGDLSAEWIAQRAAGRTIADLHSTLQQAWNTVILGIDASASGRLTKKALNAAFARVRCQ